VLIDNPIQSTEGYRELLRDPQPFSPGWASMIISTIATTGAAVSTSCLGAFRPRHLRSVFRSADPRSRSVQQAVRGLRGHFRVLDQFYREALDHGSVPVIVLFPQRREVRLRIAASR